MVNKHIGSSFENFLEDEKLLDEVDAIAVKHITDYQSEQVM